MARKVRNRKTPNESFQHNHFELRHIKPLTVNQTRVFEAWERGYHLVNHGYAGTGKTYLSVYLALREILTEERYKKLTIIRSVVPSRDMGFLPGSAREKAEVYERPYQEICDDLFGRGDGYKLLKLKRLVDFETTSFLRGTTFNDQIVVVDEINNMTFQELDTTMTRMGENCRIIFCGDYRQTDLNKKYEKSGISEFMGILKNLKGFEHVEFGIGDIVRSATVRDYIVARTEIGL